jgi:haloacetate dehalogenase
MSDVLFPGFTRRRIAVDGNEISLMLGGSGSPVLLIHGYPQTHACWHIVAPALAGRFTVVAPDLRGYGDSGAPPTTADHRPYSKRAIAAELVEVMAALGFARFAVVGHDRGARVAYRMAFDHTGRVTRLATLDVVPTHAMWQGVNKAFATATYHWFFLIQPTPFPERLIGGDPEYFIRHTLKSWAKPGFTFDERAMAEYIRAFRRPEVVHATCEDYRAGATVDDQDDAADLKAGRKIACPLLALWGEHSGFHKGDRLAVWRNWATDVRGGPIESGHFLPEEAPEATLAQLLPFLAEG